MRVHCKSAMANLSDLTNRRNPDEMLKSLCSPIIQ
jgi:hypothetical protein